MSDYEVPLMKLLSSVEKSRLEQAFIYATGLNRDQFAVNSWGFPFIPIPEQRYGEDRYRMAPKNVDPLFMGHPIYWISPELTARDENEPEEAWCIRMFYLIMSFGLWGKKDSRQWVDYIEWRKAVLSLDIDFVEQDYNTYHLSNMPKSRFDQLGILTEEQMRIPMTQWLREYEDTMRQCESILDDQLGDFFVKQAVALQNAVDIFGEHTDMRDPSVSAINNDGWWMREVHPELGRLDREYSDAIVDGTGVSFIGEPLDRLIDKIVDQMEVMEQSVAILMVPVIRTATTESEAFSEMLTYYRLGVHQSLSSQNRWDYEPLLDKLFVDYPMRNDGVRYNLNELSTALYKHYFSVWKRLRLAAYNYEALRSNDIPMTTYEELHTYLVSAYSDSSGDEGINDVFEDKVNGGDIEGGGESTPASQKVVDTIIDGDLERLGLSQKPHEDEDESADKKFDIASISDDDDDALFEAMSRNASSRD